MKVTRYPQSCILVAKDDHQIIIDPGMHFLQTHALDELSAIEAVLYTHEHADHYEPKIAEALYSRGVKLYANASTATLIGGGRATVVQDGATFQAGVFTVTARELPHCKLSDGRDGPQNTGYVIDDILFHPGDGKDIDNLQVDNVALPITGPDISMLDAFQFAIKLGVKVAIPIHYQLMGADADVYAMFAKNNNMPFELRALADGASTEI